MKKIGRYVFTSVLLLAFSALAVETPKKLQASSAGSASRYSYSTYVEPGNGPQNGSHPDHPESVYCNVVNQVGNPSYHYLYDGTVDFYNSVNGNNYVTGILKYNIYRSGRFLTMGTANKANINLYTKFLDDKNNVLKKTTVMSKDDLIQDDKDHEIGYLKDEQPIPANTKKISTEVEIIFDIRNLGDPSCRIKREITFPR